MCRVCDCQGYIKQGSETVLKRVVEIIEELGVTPGNAALFEDGEYICGLIGPRISVEASDAEVWEVVHWLNRAHEQVNEATNRAALTAAREVFRRLPAGGSPRETLTLWHQLEQLEREIRSQESISALAPHIRAAIEAVGHVHDNRQDRIRQLQGQYGLPG